MKFSDIFVPRWQNSNPTIRLKAIARLNDMKLLAQIAENDEDPEVCAAAHRRLESFDNKVRVTEED